MRNLSPIILNMMNSKMLIFFLKNNSEFDKKDHIKNLVSFFFVIDVPVTTRRPMMYYHCLLQCGANCHSTETISNKRWKQLGTKTKDWTGLDKSRNLFESTEWEKGPEGVRLHERCYLTLSFK